MIARELIREKHKVTGRIRCPGKYLEENLILKFQGTLTILAAAYSTSTGVVIGWVGGKRDRCYCMAYTIDRFSRDDGGVLMHATKLDYATAMARITTANDLHEGYTVFIDQESIDARQAAIDSKKKVSLSVVTLTDYRTDWDWHTRLRSIRNPDDPIIAGETSVHLVKNKDGKLAAQRIHAPIGRYGAEAEKVVRTTAKEFWSYYKIGLEEYSNNEPTHIGRNYTLGPLDDKLMEELEMMDMVENF
jgi:hypothetical protein